MVDGAPNDIDVAIVLLAGKSGRLVNSALLWHCRASGEVHLKLPTSCLPIGACACEGRCSAAGGEVQRMLPCGAVATNEAPTDALVELLLSGGAT